MANERRFRLFAQRITRGYVVLAVLLIAIVAGASSVLAFILYATSLNESVDAATARAQQRVEYYQSLHKSLAQYAPNLVKDAGRGRIHIYVYDIAHKRIAGNYDAQPSAVGRTVAELMNVHRGIIREPDGVIVLQPDFDAFAHLMERYWLIIFPIGVICVLLAWVAARGITRRAISPLIDVTDALNGIAEGDFTPKMLLEHGTGLYDLTAAYNDVAYRLHTATAEQRRQSAEMRQFIADAGHELRTPLTIFMGYLEALREGVVRDSEAVHRVHETMLDESRKMRTIIEKLILLARMEREPQRQTGRIDLSSIAARAVDALRPIAGDRVELHIDGPAEVVGDDGELYEAIKNVVENAVRYAPESAVRVSVLSDSEGPEVVVEDRGPGMQTVDVEHAFDRFYRGVSRRDVEGSGLGLAIAKRAVERMGGTIALRSNSVEGTRVSMRFGSEAAGDSIRA